MILEKTIESCVNAYAKKKYPGILVRKMNGTGFRGWPDRGYWYKESIHFFIEFKREGGQLSAAQKVVINALANAGHRVYIIDKIEDGKEVVDQEAKGEVYTTCLSTGSD